MRTLCFLRLRMTMSFPTSMFCPVWLSWHTGGTQNAGSEPPPFVVVVNWFEELRQRMGGN